MGKERNTERGVVETGGKEETKGKHYPLLSPSLPPSLPQATLHVYTKPLYSCRNAIRGT